MHRRARTLSSFLTKSSFSSEMSPEVCQLSSLQLIIPRTSLMSRMHDCLPMACHIPSHPHCSIAAYPRSSQPALLPPTSILPPIMPTSSRSTSFTSYMLRALYLTVAICALFPLFILCYVSSAAFQSLLIHMHFVNFPFPFLTDFTKSTEPQWLSPALPCAAYIHTASNYSSASTPRSQLAGWLLSPASRCPSTSSLSTHLPASAASDTRCSSAAPFVHPILYLHGNAENRAYRPSHDRYNFFTAFPLCADVFVFDYSGFGENSGWPTQQLIVEDAHVMLDSVNHWPGVDPSAVIVFGHSLGSAVAVQLLSSITRGNSTRYSGHRPAGLIVEGAFTNVRGQTHVVSHPSAAVCSELISVLVCSSVFACAGCSGG